MRITLRVVRVLPWTAEVFGAPSVRQTTDNGPQRFCSPREPSTRSWARIQTRESNLRVHEQELILLVLMTPTSIEPLKKITVLPDVTGMLTLGSGLHTGTKAEWNLLRSHQTASSNSPLPSHPAPLLQVVKGDAGISDTAQSTQCHRTLLSVLVGTSSF